LITSKHRTRAADGYGDNGYTRLRGGHEAPEVKRQQTCSATQRSLRKHHQSIAAPKSRYDLLGIAYAALDVGALNEQGPCAP
jgi:hypothetical protein